MKFRPTPRQIGLLLIAGMAISFLLALVYVYGLGATLGGIGLSIVALAALVALAAAVVLIQTK